MKMNENIKQFIDKTDTDRTKEDLEAWLDLILIMDERCTFNKEISMINPDISLFHIWGIEKIAEILGVEVETKRVSSEPNEYGEMAYHKYITYKGKEFFSFYLKKAGE